MTENIYEPSATIPSANEIGAKARNLAAMAAAGFRVPPFFVLTARAFESAAAHDAGDGAGDGGAVPIVPGGSLREEILGAYDALLERYGNGSEPGGGHDRPRPAYVAVRSSAVGEDGAGFSYAGQLSTCLFVRRDDLIESIAAVWHSGYSERVAAYRRQGGLEGTLPAVAVIVQVMIDAETAGVAFGLDPVSGDRSAVMVSAVLGLGEGLVGGELDADVYTVRGGAGRHIAGRLIANKAEAVRFDAAAGRFTRREPVPAGLREQPALRDEQIVAVDAVTRALGVLFARPQDVEWCFRGDTLYVLQSRPVTTLATTPDTTANKVLWDNSNIIESYSGMTTPLTFSFIRDVYTEVYKDFCRIMGVDEETITRNASSFEMLGLVRGRVYYNLLNWYRVLALLPGYSVNARFMEQMMGVREPLTEKPRIHPSSKNQYVRLGLALYRLVRNLTRLPRDIVAFHRHLDATLLPLERARNERARGAGEIHDAGAARPAELVELYGALQDGLLMRWRTPILNDFYTMIFYGLAKGMLEKAGAEGATLLNDLFCGEGGMISAEPPRHLRAIANSIAAREDLVARFVAAEPEAALELVARESPEIAAAIEEYRARFGDRCVGELKLETITPAQEPALLVRMLSGYVRQGVVDTADDERRARSVRSGAEAAAAKATRGIVRGPLFRYLLGQARSRVRNRENLRFERTRVFAAIRTLFLDIGRAFAWEGIIDAERDIFHLTKEEIFSFIGGTAAGADLRGLIALRKAEYARYAALPSPADRFATYGPVYHANGFTAPVTASERGAGLSGIPCSPGIVRAPVRKVNDPMNPPDLEGAIMVAERTDPGWAPLFPMARGILVERGSPLSHSAIVAREMGIPAVVGIAGLFAALIDGEVVEMDGATGTVTLFRDRQTDGGDDA